MDWGCDGKRQSGSLAIASWNTALKVRYLFPHISFKPFQRLHCYQNTSEVSLTCLHLSVISTSSLQFRLNTTSLFLSSLSGWAVTSQWPATLAHSNAEGHDAPTAPPLREQKAKICRLWLFLNFKMFFTFTLEMNVPCEVTFKCKARKQITDWQEVSNISSERLFNLFVVI